MTMQEAFNKAYLGLKAQGFCRAINNEDTCVYLAKDGKKCAIGQLLEGENGKNVLGSVHSPYIIEVEGGRVTSKEVRFKEIEGLPMDFLAALQVAHDSGRGHPKYMEHNLRKVAEYYNLTVPE